MTSKRHRIIIEGNDATNYSAYSPDLPGVVATGATRKECEREMREAIQFHLEGLDQDVTEDAATPLLAFEDVSKRYPGGMGELVVLNRVSFEIYAGTHLGILGGRHSGKSTLLRLAAGIDTPSDGLVRLQGRDITAPSARKRGKRSPHLAYIPIFESSQTSQNMSVVDFVTIALLGQRVSVREAERRARSILHEVEQGDQADRRIGSLSPIDRLWVELASALAQGPDVLLVDEPALMPSLDERYRFLRLLRSFATEQHMTLVIASQEPTVLLGLDVLMSIGFGELSLIERESAVIVDFPTRGKTARDRSSG
jgi:ABC-type cobalamin/Fe3+-siderophores transport system ATPase subunit